jgi:hypothetical protein
MANGEQEAGQGLRAKARYPAFIVEVDYIVWRARPLTRNDAAICLLKTSDILAEIKGRQSKVVFSNNDLGGACAKKPALCHALALIVLHFLDRRAQHGFKF